MVELRRFLRLSKEYRLEYGPFPPSGGDKPLQTSVIKNIGGGGLLFRSEEPFPAGRQLLLKIYLPGWRQEGEEIVEAADPGAEAAISALAQVRRAEFDSSRGGYLVAVEFLGRVLP